MLTRPNVMDPFQSARAMTFPFDVLRLMLRLSLQLLLRAHPVIEIASVTGPAFQIQVVRVVTDVVFIRLLRRFVRLLHRFDRVG